jgi:hypothetical protein
MAYYRPEAKHGRAQDAQLMKNTIRFLTVMFGTLVSLVAFVAVIQRWHAFNANTKFEAIAFLLVLVAFPMSEIVARKRKQDGLGRFHALIFGYMLVLLAIEVFSAR